VPVVYACNSSSLEDWGWEDHGLRPAQTIHKTVSKITQAKWAGSVSQAIVSALQMWSPEFKSQSYQNIQTKNSEETRNRRNVPQYTGEGIYDNTVANIILNG
jgi:hypothetical protein